MLEIKMEKFNGPLDLLLQLIEKDKLEITEISLAQVTEEYLLKIEGMIDINPEDLADFLIVATRLLLLKSRAILPVLEDDESIDDLQKQLKMYKEFVEASKKILLRLKEGKVSFARNKMPMKTEIKFSPGQKITEQKLREAFLQVLKKLDPLVKIPKQIIEKTVTLQQKIFDLKNFLQNSKKIGFRDLVSKSENKTEVIMNFLAILELLKQKELRVRQGNLFEDIIIEKN